MRYNPLNFSFVWGNVRKTACRKRSSAAVGFLCRVQWTIERRFVMGPVAGRRPASNRATECRQPIRGKKRPKWGIRFIRAARRPADKSQLYFQTFPTEVLQAKRRRLIIKTSASLGLETRQIQTAISARIKFSHYILTKSLWRRIMTPILFRFRSFKSRIERHLIIFLAK